MPEIVQDGEDFLGGVGSAPPGDGAGSANLTPLPRHRRSAFLLASPETVTRGHRGALSELRACAWLVENGYDVFRNISFCGAIDIVAVKIEEDGRKETVFVDVKSGSVSEKTGNVAAVPLSDSQKKLGVRRLIVTRKWIGWDSDLVVTRRPELHVGAERRIPGTQPRRPHKGNIKLSYAIAEEIRKNYEAGATVRKLMEMYKVKQPTIYAVLTGKTWNEKP